MSKRKRDEGREKEDLKEKTLDQYNLADSDRAREKKKRKHRDKEDENIELEGGKEKRKRKHKDKEKDQEMEDFQSPSKTMKPPAVRALSKSFCQIRLSYGTHKVLINFIDLGFIGLGWYLKL